MKKRVVFAAAFIIAGSMLFSSCKKDKPAEPNDEEVITTLVVKLTPAGGGATLEYEFDDADGPGGAAPTIDEIVLAPSTTYNVSLEVLNRTVSPVEDITTEIEEESDAHRFYYEISGGATVTVSNLDNDANGVPVGLTSTWTTGAVSTGKLRITLRHYGSTPPNKAAADPVNSDKSSTDISTESVGDFTVKVQ